MRDEIKKFIRVDHAGEYGAVRIYSGQLAVLGRSAQGPTLEHMLEQEEHHLKVFSELIATRRVRPTVMLPFWHVAGFVLGAATAAMGSRAAMACTVAVEETIDAHYAAQEAALDASEAPLSATIAQFRAEELEHRDIGIANGAEQAPAYRLLTAVIKTGCIMAIKISERI